MSVKQGWEGRYLEDFTVGDVYRAPIGRTITEVDNTWFTLLTNNDNQIHFNDHYSSKTPWGKPLVNSAFTIAVVTGLGVRDLTMNGFALGWDKIRLPNPVFAGDTLYSQSEVLAVRESASDPKRGIITVRTLGIKQDGTVVVEFERSAMVWKRAHAPGNATFPEPKPYKSQL
ncbi:MAG: MaoC family dehydratase [Chloroflexota bacterium]